MPRLLTLLSALALCFGCVDDADDGVSADDDISADDDVSTDDDDDGTAFPVWEMPVGMAFGDEEFRGQAFLDDLTALGTTRIQNNIWWCQFEPTDDDYHFTLTDAFVDEIDESTRPLLRLNVRGCHWATTAESGYTVPADLTVGGTYYEFVYEVVARTAGRVDLFENDWEVDEQVNWEGTPGEYAEMMRTFHRAVTDADPEATVVCGGSWADSDDEDQLIAEFNDDITLLGGDLSSTPLQPDGYPDYLRMFVFGLQDEPDLEARRDRIQVRQLVQRSIVGMAGGLVAQHWWNLVAERVGVSVDVGVYFRHFTFGKLTLNVPDPDPGGMEFTPLPVHEDFAANLAWLNGCASARRVDTGRNLTWLYEVGRADGTTAYVVWDQRDPFEGECEPAVEVSFAVPWEAAMAHDAFGEPVGVAVEEGVARLAITGTPVFVEP